MRAAQGAAAPVTKPKKEPGVDARPVLALSVQLSAAMNPRIGGARVGEAPRPFFPPISSGRNGGARRAGTRREAGPPLNGRPQVAPTASAQAADHSLPRKRDSSFPPLGLLLPTPTTSLGRRGGPIGCAGSYPIDGAPAAQASGNPLIRPSGGKAPGARCAPPGDTPVSGQKSAPPGIRAALVFTALRGNTPNQGWQAAACRGCCAGR